MNSDFSAARARLDAAEAKREEVLLRTADNTALRLYVSTIPTDYRFHTFLEDPVYRISIATQNVAYNQPTQPGFYFGPELKGTVFRGCKIRRKENMNIRIIAVASLLIAWPISAQK